MNETTVCSKTVSRGEQLWKINKDGTYQVLMFGSHGPSDPPVGLSWKWHYISSEKVPDDVKKLA